MVPEEPDFTVGFSPGERLKAKRTELGVSLKEVSNALLISVSNLKALENNRYEDLPGLTYVVGYWRSYANILDVDISDEIEIHKNRLRSSDVLAAYHLGQYADVHQKKSRKGSVILLILLFSGFLGGLWYWQKPTDGQTGLLPGNQAGEQFNTLDNGNNAADGIVTNSVLSLPESSKVEQPDSFVDTQEPVVTGIDAEVDVQAEPGVSEEPVSGSGDQPDSFVDTQEPVVTGIDAEVDVQAEPGVSEEPVSGSGDQPDSFVDTQEPVVTGIDVEVDVQAEPGVSEEPVSGSGDQPDSFVDTQEPVVTGIDAEVDVQAEPGVSEELVSGSVREVFGSGSGYDANSPEWLKVAAHKTVWIDIRSGQDEKLVFRMVNEGENMEINGLPPFYVFIGSLDGVELFYLGESVDMPPHSERAVFKIHSR